MASSSVAAMTTFSTPYLILDDFLPHEDALAMRRQIDDHFAEPQKHTPDRHQIWNYWHVPGLYTYLRTLPEKVIEGALELTRPLLRQRAQEALVELPFPLPLILGDAPLLTQRFDDVAVIVNCGHEP